MLRTTLPTAGEENWFASPTLVDLDGDGKFDIVAARRSVLFAWKHDGTLLWKTAFGHSASVSPEKGDRRMWASVVAGDFDGDGSPELAVASDVGGNPDANVAVYDARGELLPGWPVKFGGTEIRGITAADVTGDGRLEVIVQKTDDGPSTAVFGLDGRMMPGWPQVQPGCGVTLSPSCLDYGAFNQSVGAGDLDGDRVDDVVFTYDAIGFGIFRGDGTPFPTAEGFADPTVASVEAYHDLALSMQGWGVDSRSEFTDTPPVIADVDADGSPELVLVGNHEHTDSTSSRGDTVWVVNPDGTRPEGWERPKEAGAPLRTDDPAGPNLPLQRPGPAVAQLDGAPGLEIVFTGQDGKLHVYGPRGEERWSFSYGSAWPYVGASEPVIADLNADGALEIVFTTFTTGEATAHLYVLGSDGALLHQLPLPGRGAMSAPTVGDLDADGQLELLVSLKDEGVQIWELPGSQPNCIAWETGRGGPRRTGAAH